MEDGRILDAQITASSCYSVYSCTGRARLNQKKSGSNVGSWCAKENDQNQYIQVDLLQLHLVKGIETQGRNGLDQWVTSYEVLYSLDGLIWTTMLNEDNPGSTVFPGNTDQDSVVMNDFYDIVARFIRIKPVTWSEHISLRFEVIGKVQTEIEDSPRPLGMKVKMIPNSAITASTEFANGPAKRARLDLGPSGALKGAWIPTRSDSNQWIQVDLSTFYIITGVITQGRQDADRWVTAFAVEYSRDGSHWISIMGCNGRAQVFTGNSDRNTKVTTVFERPIEGRFIRIRPTAWSGFIALRLEILGMGPVASHHYEPLKLGMEDKQIKVNQLTSSTCYSTSRCVDRARLNQAAEGQMKGAWTAKFNDQNQWIQVDLLTDYVVEGIVTQGKADLDHWVTTFSIKYAPDGHPGLIDVVDDEGAVVVFHGNSDRNTVVTNTLPQPITARWVRIIPKTWNGYISMRFDLLGEGPSNMAATPGKIGIEDGRVSAPSMSASSCYSVTQCVSSSRLNQTLGAWSPAVDDENQWIQVDLQSAFEVTDVITQGRAGVNQWVKSYKLSYSIDGISWTMISDCHPGPMIFRGNYDRRSTAKSTLNPPVTARFFRLHPVTWNDEISLRWELMGKGPITVKDTAVKLGLEDFRIPNSAMTASSQYNVYLAPSRARLNQGVYGGYRGAWAVKTNDHTQWLQIDLGGTYLVSGIITQGRSDTDQWVTAYKVAYGLNGQNFTTVLSRGTQQEKVFSGNSDRDTEVTNHFFPPLTTRFIRALPNEWHGHISMRMELLGVGPIASLGKEPEALGMQSNRIPDSSLTASSQWNAYSGAARGRLNLARYGSWSGGWIARTRDVNQWLQVNLLKPYRIFSVATQGRDGVNQWVTSYKLACSNDGVNFKIVQTKCSNPNVDMIFTGNTDYRSVVHNELPMPEVCRYVRLMPVTWYGYIVVRMELYGEGPVTE